MIFLLLLLLPESETDAHRLRPLQLQWVNQTQFISSRLTGFYWPAAGAPSKGNSDSDWIIS